ncbi:MAG: nucleotidyltransferase domain-containing protein, partial [Eubacteriales bacterium]|nr:nucleotidyltransferase domain-containing protein [Eubacteriales bacterium]
MTGMDFRELLKKPEYDFIRENPRLGDRIILLGVSGSYGYGTNREGSDVDLRGVALNLPSDMIGLTSFEQVEDRATDTVIYSFNKLIGLLLNCNPNTIEILGLEDDQYLIKTPIGQELLDHSGLFLSRRAAASFGHYADAQLRRLQNAVARDSLPQPDREVHIFKSVSHALEDFNRKQSATGSGNTRLYIDKAQTEGLETEIFLDAEFVHYPLRRYNDLMNTLHSVVREYDRIGKRNHKKDERHLNKHAMHLVRLFMMGIDILEKGEIRTRRPEEDLRLLRSIRDGAFMADGILNDDFYQIVAEYESRFAEAEKVSRLPDNPDLEAVGRFVEAVNRRVVTEAADADCAGGKP